MSRLPLTGTAEYLAVLDPFVPDQFINERWNMRPTRGPRWRFSAAQLWRVHLLALLTPAHSINLLVALLPEQPAWRAFARLRRLHEVPDVRILHAFRARLGVLGLRQINDTLLQPLIQEAALWEGATALMDATDLPAACSGFKKKTPVPTPPLTPRWVVARSKPARAASTWATRNTPSACGGVRTSEECCWCHWSVGSARPTWPRAACWPQACVTVTDTGLGGRATWWRTWAIWPPRARNSAGNSGAWR
ncbi:MAG: hypothetical protein FJ280_28825 [Planctomycetes bacterium]|nr:hypothetical protein [Planctomycetota bacterium]